MKQLKRSELSVVRMELLKKQNNRCPITLKPINMSNSVVDHCHVTGTVRAVLTRGGNGLEGKVSNLLTRWGGCGNNITAKAALLRRLADYWELHRIPQTDYKYPPAPKRRIKRK